MTKGAIGAAFIIMRVGCIAAYGFLMLERLRGAKKTPLDSKRLAYPKASARAELGSMHRHPRVVNR